MAREGLLKTSGTAGQRVRWRGNGSQAGVWPAARLTNMPQAGKAQAQPAASNLGSQVPDVGAFLWFAYVEVLLQAFFIQLAGDEPVSGPQVKKRFPQGLGVA